MTNWVAEKTENNTDELWDVYDANGNKTGKIISRHNGMLADGEYHLAVDVWIVNAKQQWLIQKRAPNKQKFPNMWQGSAGGAVIAGENSWQGCQRELKEELGISLKEGEAREVYSFVRHGKVHAKVWLVQKEVDLTDIQMQEAEVSGVKWADLADIEQLLANNQFVPTVIEGLHKCLEILGKHK